MLAQSSFGIIQPEEKPVLKQLNVRLSTALLPHRDSNGFRKMILALSSSGMHTLLSCGRKVQCVSTLSRTAGRRDCNARTPACTRKAVRQGRANWTCLSRREALRIALRRRQDSVAAAARHESGVLAAVCVALFAGSAPRA